MKRRKLLKQMGLMSLAGLSIGSLASCAEKKEDEKETKPVPTEEQATPPMNRNKMGFKDPENPTDFELKHTPDIVLGEADAKGFTRIDIIVGSKNIIHPTVVNHWIDYAGLYADEKLIGLVHFEAGKASGFTAFKVRLEGVKTLRAEIGCNLHGIWESRKDVTL